MKRIKKIQKAMLLSLIGSAFLTSCASETIIESNDGLSIVTLTPFSTEILVDLGASSYIMGKDIHSERFNIENSYIFDMFSLNMEQLISLDPDLIFISFMPDIFYGTSLQDRVYYFPSANSIYEIEEQITKIGNLVSRNSEANYLLLEMNTKIESVLNNINYLNIQNRTVYFEIGAHPIFTIGNGTFLNYILEMIGSINIFSDYEGWIQASDEEIILRNPYVIITNVAYIDDPVAEVVNRAGFNIIDAVINERVIKVDPFVTSSFNHRVADAIYYIAKAVFPEISEIDR